MVLSLLPDVTTLIFCRFLKLPQQFFFCIFSRNWNQTAWFTVLWLLLEKVVKGFVFLSFSMIFSVCIFQEIITNHSEITLAHFLEWISSSPVNFNVKIQHKYSLNCSLLCFSLNFEQLVKIYLLRYPAQSTFSTKIKAYN